MENMEQTPDLEQLIREQPGPEVFQRVWARVMPDQKDSPLAVAAVPRREETRPVPTDAPEVSPEQKVVLVPPEDPVPPAASVPPVCLGEDSRGDVDVLTELMELAQENLSAGQALMGRMSRNRRSFRNQPLADLAADHRRAARQLSAARFLITGEWFRPEGRQISLPAGLALALRDQFAREQRWSYACEQAAAAAGDRCLRELYLELAQDGALHAGEIRSLLERM